MREDKRLTNRFLRSHASVESIRKQIEAHTTIHEKVSTSVDLPISNEGKRVLTFAAEEAERLGHLHIGTEHLLLGLMRVETCFAAELLKERGVRLDTLREQFAQPAAEAPTPVATASAPATGLFRDLTQAATDGLLEPVVARNLELDCVIEILSRHDRKNPILIGQQGAGKTAIVEFLAQGIAGGMAPSFLADKRVLAIGAERRALMGKGRDKRRRQAKRKDQKTISAARAKAGPSSDPPVPDEPDASVPAPVKPKPHLRSGAMALPEPEPEDELVVVTSRSPVILQ